MPGRGTVEVDGTVYSSQTGVAAVDSTRHIVSVKASAGPPVVPEEGSTFIGVVEKVQEKMAIVNIVVVDGHKLQPPSRECCTSQTPVRDSSGSWAMSASRTTLSGAR